MKLIKFLSIVISLVIDAVTILVYVSVFPVVSDNFTLSCIRLATCIGLPIGTILLLKYVAEETAEENHTDGDYTSVTRNRYFFSTVIYKIMTNCGVILAAELLYYGIVMFVSALLGATWAYYTFI